MPTLEHFQAIALPLSMLQQVVTRRVGDWFCGVICESGRKFSQCGYAFWLIFHLVRDSEITTCYLRVRYRHYFFWLSYCLLPLGLWASNVREDSLLRVLNTLPQDTQRVLTYNELFKATFTSEPLKALDYGQKALKLARELKYQTGISRLCNNLGVWHSKRGNYKESLSYYAYAREALAQIDDSNGTANCEMNIGSVHYKLGHYDQALRQYATAYKIYSAQSDTVSMLSAVNNIGSVYKELGRYPEALRAYMAALNLRERLHDPVELGMSCGNVGSIFQLEGMLGPAREFLIRSLLLAREGNDKYGEVAALTSIAEIDMEQSLLQQARPKLRQAKAIAEEIEDQYGLASTMLSLAELHLLEAQPDSAQQCYMRALEICRAIGRTQGVAQALNHIGSLQLGEGNVAAAESALLESLQLSEILHTPDLCRDNHLLLSQLYGQTGRFEAGYSHQAQYLSLKDSLYSTEKSKQIAEMQVRYEATRQQAVISRLSLQATQDQLRIANASRRNLILVVILLAGTVLALIYFYRLYQERRHNRSIEEKNLEIRQQRDLLEAQNHQIREINVSLEKIVEQRTLAMRNAKQELDTFLYESAHALRRPLLRIQGLQDLLEAEEDPLVKTRFRGQMRMTLAGMDELLHKLIYVSESGHGDLRLEPVALRSIVMDVVAQQAMAETLLCAIAQDYKVVTDAYLIKVLLTVIIENGFRFLDLGHSGQSVTVATEQDEAFVRIIVADTGSGIAPEHLPKVCEMFFRGPNHRGGNGLGLFIASKVVDKLHGRLEITSEIGVGTTVTVELPRHDL